MPNISEQWKAVDERLKEIETGKKTPLNPDDYETKFEIRDPNCLFCKNYYFSPGTEDYSEVTPGEEAEIGCIEGEFYVDGNKFEVGISDEGMLPKLMIKALSCGKFEISELALEMGIKLKEDENESKNS